MIGSQRPNTRQRIYIVDALYLYRAEFITKCLLLGSRWDPCLLKLGAQKIIRGFTYSDKKGEHFYFKDTYHAFIY